MTVRIFFIPGEARGHRPRLQLRLAKRLPGGKYRQKGDNGEGDKKEYRFRWVPRFFGGPHNPLE